MVSERTAGATDPVQGMLPSRERPDEPPVFERAICDLRCGAFIIMAGHDGAYLLQAAEFLDEASLRRGSLYAGREPRLVVTARRAAALGLREAEPGAGAIPVLLTAPTPLSPAALRQLADPTAALSRRPGDMPALAPGLTMESGRSDGALPAALRLLRDGRLLPAFLAWELSAERAGTLVSEQGLTRLEAGYDGLTPKHRLTAVAEADVPLQGAEQTHVVAFRPADGRNEHLAIVIGAIDPAVPMLVRIHSECFTGDLLGSLRCDCGDQLRGAIAEMGRRGAGILLYLAQEGRGIGLVNKLRAYQLQDAGADTLEANEELGFDADERDFAPAAEMLRQLGVSRIRLMTNNPTKVAALEAHGITIVERVAHAFSANTHNHRYLETKARRAGHLF